MQKPDPMRRQTAPIPVASHQVFEGSIEHPELWLWDSWTCEVGTDLHLYCLALSRRSFEGEEILPTARNDHSFHVRHFRSEDGGQSWRDLGAALLPGLAEDGADARNVWSGSVLPRGPSDFLFGYTGVRERGADRPFLQTICVGASTSPGRMLQASARALSCPLRDYESILDAGFYLGPKSLLGDRMGEEGGPILAWRDPFLVRDGSGVLNAFWSAKIGPSVPAVARARLRETEAGVELDKLYAPLRLPDAHEFTQAEVPKVYFDEGSGLWLLLVSACDRIFEGQPDGGVKQEQRLYVCESLDGAWRPAAKGGSVLPGTQHMFGSSVTRLDFAHGKLSLIGPFSENAGTEKQLSFPPVRDIAFEPVSELI